MKKILYTILIFVLVLSACGSTFSPEPTVSDQSPQFSNHPLELVIEYSDDTGSFRIWKFSDEENTTCYLTQNTQFRNVAIDIWCNQ